MSDQQMSMSVYACDFSQIYHSFNTEDIISSMPPLLEQGNAPDFLSSNCQDHSSLFCKPVKQLNLYSITILCNETVAVHISMITGLSQSVEP